MRRICATAKNTFYRIYVNVAIQMNSRVWGPPTWRLLHGTCFVTAAEDLHTVIKALGRVMPCSICRDSYVVFYKELNGSQLKTTVNRGLYPEWLWKLHNKVVEKLLRQNLEKARTPLDAQDVVLESSILPFDVLRKRLVVSVPYFSREDVFTVLGIFAYSATADDACKLRKKTYLSFARAVARLLQSSATYPELGVALIKALSHVTVSNFDSEILRTLASVDLEHEPSEKDMRQYIAVIRIAEAGTCTIGGCV